MQRVPTEELVYINRRVHRNRFVKRPQGDFAALSQKLFFVPLEAILQCHRVHTLWNLLRNPYDCTLWNFRSEKKRDILLCFVVVAVVVLKFVPKTATVLLKKEKV